jgi:hypothetical protein
MDNYRGKLIGAFGQTLSDSRDMPFGGRTLEEALAEGDAIGHAMGFGPMDRRTERELLTAMRPAHVHAIVEGARQLEYMATNMTFQDILAWRATHPEVRSAGG